MNNFAFHFSWEPIIDKNEFLSNPKDLSASIIIDSGNWLKLSENRNWIDFLFVYIREVKTGRFLQRSVVISKRTIQLEGIFQVVEAWDAFHTPWSEPLQSGHTIIQALLESCGFRGKKECWGPQNLGIVAGEKEYSM